MVIVKYDLRLKAGKVPPFTKVLTNISRTVISSFSLIVIIIVLLPSRFVFDQMSVFGKLNFPSVNCRGYVSSNYKRKTFFKVCFEFYLKFLLNGTLDINLQKDINFCIATVSKTYDALKQWSSKCLRKFWGERNLFLGARKIFLKT